MRAGLANGTGRLARALQARLQAVTPPPSIETLPCLASAMLSGRLSGRLPVATPGPEIECAPVAEPPLLVIEDFSEELWASLTFSGIRHRLDLRLQGRATEIEQAMAAISAWTDEDDPLLAGHFLAEVQVTETAREISEGGRMSLCLRLDALTIKE